MRPLPFLVFAGTFVAPPLAAQVDDVPPGLARIEVERSRACVGILARVDELNATLEPLALRSRRLQAIAQAIALEERTVVDNLLTEDPVEARIRDWFASDLALAQRYVANPQPSIQAERSAGRETIQRFVAETLAGVQAEANALLDDNQALVEQAGPCDGAIFVRGAVLEACAEEEGPICEAAARPPSEEQRFRFVDDPENVWDIQQLRPWTTPTPLRPSPTGQIDGARTVGYARIGNVVVTVAFTPMFRDRTEATPAEIASFEETNRALGLTFSHPELAFVPALGIRAALPTPLAGESRYVIHFGASTAPDVVWTGEAGTGAAIEGTIPLDASHVERLRAGEMLSLTALGSATDEAVPSFRIELSTVNQVQATSTLLGYMAEQLSTDLSALTRDRGGAP